MNDGSWTGGRGGWGGGGWGGGDFNRRVNLENNFYNRDYGGWNNAWGDGGYGVAVPGAMAGTAGALTPGAGGAVPHWAGDSRH